MSPDSCYGPHRAQDLSEPRHRASGELRQTLRRLHEIQVVVGPESECLVNVVEHLPVLGSHADDWVERTT